MGVNTESESELEKIVSQQPKRKDVLLKDIVVLPQMRQTFEQELLEVLADNITIVGLLNPVILNNKKGSKKFELVAGERRYRAYNINYERYGKPFHRIPANVFFNLSQEQHDAIQGSENSYVIVPPAEAAESYAKSYERIKQRREEQGKPFTKTLFARAFGRSISTINDALKFVGLEVDIREWVKKKLLNYGAAVQLSRIDDSRRRRNMAELAMFRRYNEEDVKVKIDGILQEQQGQEALFEEFKLEPQKEITTIRELLGKDTHAAGIYAAQYHNRARTLIREKLRCDPFRLRVVRKNVKILYFAFKDLYEDLRKKRPIDDSDKAGILTIRYDKK